jgi:hypothetical protein
MSNYRAHIVVFDGDKRLTVPRLKTMSFMDAEGRQQPVGPMAGTRLGTPGIWAYASTRMGLLSAVERWIGRLSDRGLTVAIYTTNNPSEEALRNVRRGRETYVRTVSRG